ncbi:member of major facilitator superfamily multidrug-resistance protein [Scheffersomyces coipomensis]|uniref:member of major facilitator superfamily multidrug-resistance protein n=1 Tax=Scheffersomyces coipomensis TaxID=1788519 RepID=UPI00315C8466
MAKLPSHLGIQQPNVREVTGTIIMMDDANPEENINSGNVSDNDDGISSVHSSLSIKRSINGIILNPQPHDSPNDPLNWPILKRDLCLLLIGFQSFIGGGQTPILAAGMNSLVVEFNRPLATISYLVGGFMLSLGFGSVFASPTAVLYGKRLVYLGGITLFLVGSIWAANANSFGSLMGARVIIGLGASPTECLPSSTIAEIYFAHERAYRVGIYTMLLLGGKNIIPLLSGLIFQNLNRHWLFWILSIFLGINLILTFLFVPDTFWDRNPTPNKRSQEESEAARKVKTYHPPEERPNAFALHRPSQFDVVDIESLSSSIYNTTNITNQHNPVGIDNPDETIPNHINSDTPRRSFIKDMALYSGRHTLDSWWMVCLRPFFLYTYPSVLFGSFVYCFAVVWLIVISETISDIFMGSGYDYDQQTVGLFYVSPFVGGILGSLSAGLISDRLSRYLVSKNHGVYEPEFRLLMIIPSTFFISFGLMGFGWSSQNKDAWIAPVIFFGCVGFGSSMASTTAITFTVDSYKMFAAESLVSFNFLKNLMGFIFSLFNNDFIHSRGERTAFLTYGSVQLFLSLFAIPLYIYGKRLRSWTDDKEILRKLYHEDNAPNTSQNSRPIIAINDEVEEQEEEGEITATNKTEDIDDENDNEKNVDLSDITAQITTNDHNDNKNNNANKISSGSEEGTSPGDSAATTFISNNEEKP